MKNNRRKFIEQAGVAAAAITLFSSFDLQKRKGQPKQVFIHHVFFWLKNQSSKEDLNKLLEGLTQLSAVKTIQRFHIGKPAATKREVIESSYAISWLTEFANDADQASYQDDPIHLKFIREYSHLWSKVIVYDSVDM